MSKKIRTNFSSNKQNLSNLINVNKIYKIDSYYSNNRIIEILNSENHLELTESDVIINHINDDTLYIYSTKANKKYYGEILIKYKVDKHLFHICVFLILLFIFALFVCILFPISIYKIKDDPIFFEITFSLICVQLILCLIWIICWPVENFNKKKLIN